MRVWASLESPCASPFRPKGRRGRWRLTTRHQGAHTRILGGDTTTTIQRDPRKMVFWAGYDKTDFLDGPAQVGPATGGPAKGGSGRVGPAKGQSTDTTNTTHNTPLVCLVFLSSFFFHLLGGGTRGEEERGGLLLPPPWMGKRGSGEKRNVHSPLLVKESGREGEGEGEIVGSILRGERRWWFGLVWSGRVWCVCAAERGMNSSTPPRRAKGRGRAEIKFPAPRREGRGGEGGIDTPSPPPRGRTIGFHTRGLSNDPPRGQQRSHSQPFSCDWCRTLTLSTLELRLKAKHLLCVVALMHSEHPSQRSSAVAG